MTGDPLRSRHRTPRYGCNRQQVTAPLISVESLWLFLLLGPPGADAWDAIIIARHVSYDGNRNRFRARRRDAFPRTALSDVVIGAPAIALLPIDA
jgi:hypothetical protein